MSDAIVLDVLSSSPVQLDVGDADPIAREEIAALAGRVTTVEGDVSGLSTRMGAVEGDVTALDGRMDAAEGDISTLGTTVDGIDARVEAIEADYVTAEDVMGALGGEAPALVSGSSRAILGDAETASWMERTTAADGAALVESIYGNTIVQDGSLLPVRMEGIETVGFNQFDKANYNQISGYIDNGSIVYNVSHTIVYIPCFPNMTYCASRLAETTNERFAIGWTAETPAVGVTVYNVSSAPTSQAIGNKMVLTTTTGANAKYLVVWAYWSASGLDVLDSLCINLSDPARNGTYEPYWSSQRTIPATNLRSAGSVYDELRKGERITRVGAVDLGTLGWESLSNPPIFRTSTAGWADQPAYPVNNENVADATAALYEQKAYGPLSASDDGRFSIADSSVKRLVIIDSRYTDAATFKAAMSGVMLHYALATPTTQPIDPPLPLSYRTGAGGTERVMVASGTTSAPPIFVTRYPLDPADLAASIAPVDGPIANTNHQVGDLLMLGWTLCKATQVIVTGETIEIGTNVTRTSVAAELAALSE